MHPDLVTMPLNFETAEHSALLSTGTHRVRR